MTRKLGGIAPDFSASVADMQIDLRGVPQAIHNQDASDMKATSARKLKAFHLAGMSGSFKRAAHLLSISPTAVSARVRSLEKDLGVQLFKRRLRRLTLTEAGAEYIRDIEAIFLTLEIATRELRTRYGALIDGRQLAKARSLAEAVAIPLR